MKIKFAEHFPEEMAFHAKDTFFREKILRTVYPEADKIPSQYRFKELRPNLLSSMRPKLHTIRKQKPEHKTGMNLEFIMNGKKFCKNAKCSGIQVLTIDVEKTSAASTTLTLIIDGETLGTVRLYAGIIVHLDQPVKELILNDGIPNAIVFVLCFQEAGDYNIIHWTDKRY